ncbi:hypothetical protein, partial [Helicobacter sp.]|uniref:hypothetical protein n=1 Tax=Helicobacter sp. TaxID=218 RepID=UPI00198DD588
MPNQNKEDKNQDNQIKNNQKNKNESNNNTNTKKKTRRKIALPRIKDIQTTPDTSLLHPILEDNL